MAPERFEVRAVRLDTLATDHGITLIKCPGPGCLVVTIGSRDRDDAPGDLVSYEKPSMAVNAKGQRAIVLGRVPVHMAEPIGQEARCRVIDPDGRLGDGAVLHAGSDVLEGVFFAGARSSIRLRRRSIFTTFSTPRRTPPRARRVRIKRNTKTTPRRWPIRTVSDFGWPKRFRKRAASR